MKTVNHLKRISQALLYAYRIQPDSLVSNNIYVKKITFQEDTELWVKNSLLNPDEKLADRVLPILVDRFEEHLKSHGITV